MVPRFARPLHEKSYSPMIITVALTGAVPDRKKFLQLPVTPEQIAEHALLCAELGATTVHLHMRDQDGKQTQDLERLAETIGLIRKENRKLVICATTTSRGATSIEERLTPLRLPKNLLPDMVSLTLGSYNTPTGINANPASEIELLLEEMAKVGVSPELEIFEPGMLYFWEHLSEKAKAPRAAIANILLGVQGASAASAKSLVDIVSLLPESLEWAVAGIGHFQKPMVALGAAMGGHVRVGMEDDPRGDHENWSNMDSVKRATRFAEVLGRNVASPDQARAALGLPLGQPG